MWPKDQLLAVKYSDSSKRQPGITVVKYKTHTLIGMKRKINATWQSRIANNWVYLQFL